MRDVDFKDAGSRNRVMGDPAGDIYRTAENSPRDVWCPADNPYLREFLDLIAEILVAEYLQYANANDQKGEHS